MLVPDQIGFRDFLLQKRGVDVEKGRDFLIGTCEGCGSVNTTLIDENLRQCLLCVADDYARYTNVKRVTDLLRSFAAQLLHSDPNVAYRAVSLATEGLSGAISPIDSEPSSSATRDES